MRCHVVANAQTFLLSTMNFSRLSPLSPIGRNSSQQFTLGSYTARTQRRKFETNIPRKGTAQLKATIPIYIYVSVSDLYIPLIDLPILLEDNECGNWD